MWFTAPGQTRTCKRVARTGGGRARAPRVAGRLHAVPKKTAGPKDAAARSRGLLSAPYKFFSRSLVRGLWRPILSHEPHRP